MANRQTKKNKETPVVNNPLIENNNHFQQTDKLNIKRK